MKQIQPGKKVHAIKILSGVLMGLCLIWALWAQAAVAQESMNDEHVQKDLQTAYAIAQTLFTDNPRGRVDLSGLQSYGFRSTRDVTIRIVDGGRQSLLITGKHKNSMNVYIVDKDGNVATNEEETERVGRSGGRR